MVLHYGSIFMTFWCAAKFPDRP